MLKRSLTRLLLLRVAGLLLMTLGIVHLIATPHIATLIRHAASPVSARWLIPPMLLNHIIVGVLLIPLGFLTTYAAPHAAGGASWSQVIVRTSALSVATLPVALFGLMGTRYYFDAPLFVVGAAVTVIVAVTLLIVAFARSAGHTKHLTVKEIYMGKFVIVAYRPRPGKEKELLRLTREHLPILRSQGLATDRPSYVMKSADGTIIEVFEWKSAAAIAAAHENPVWQAMCGRYSEACDYIRLEDLSESKNMFAEFDPVDL